MAHMIDTTTGKAAMAYVGDAPWHKLGTKLTPGASLDVWRDEARLNYEVLRRAQAGGGCWCVVGGGSMITDGSWLVSYFNPITMKRHTLIDNIDEAAADAVVERFGESADQWHRLQEVRKEIAVSAAGEGA